MTDEFADFVRDTLINAPRLSVMSGFFRKTASGDYAVPDVDVRGDRGLFFGDPAMMAFCDEYERIIGEFNRHFVASVPYVLENECRIGVALYDYANELAGDEKDQRMFSISNADGVFPRTLSGLPGSRITSLNNGLEEGFRESFYRFGVPAKADFLQGTFLDVTPQRIQQDPALVEFRGGFDIVYEHEAFQMFSNDRQRQLAYVTRLLKPDGLMILSEKLMLQNIDEYRARERHKDEKFKSRFFPAEQVHTKQEEIVRHMEDCLVTLPQLTEALGRFFAHAVLVWNSTNFNMVIASNSERKIATLLKYMLPPCIPSNFCYEPLPQVLLGMESTRVEFGRPRSRKKS
jgi:hypothetical protein